MKKIKFLLVALVFVFLGTCFFVSNKNNVCFATAQSDGNFSNLVVFVRFDGEEEFVDDICGKTCVKDIVENSYSKADFSVRDYFQKVSNGKVDMQNMYLFDKNGGSFVLDCPRGYFCKKDDNNDIGYESQEKSLRMQQLRQKWADVVNNATKSGCTISDVSQTYTYDFLDLDKNNDGYIDSITIIFKYSQDFYVDWSDCLWNYQSYSSLVQIDCQNKTLTSNAYLQISANFGYVYTDKNGTEFASLKTMIHETGHIFGLKDLYKTESNSPVYYMSAMAKAISPVPQYISAKEREVLGWLDKKNISVMPKQGTYTIFATTSDVSDKVVCFKCDIPSLEKTLYLEYRRFDGSLNKYDSQSKLVYNMSGQNIKGISLKSGLVCFLIDKDTLFPNNLYCSGTNWNYQVLGGTYSTKSDSALASGESLQITTDLCIKVSDMDQDNLTFEIIGTDIASGHVHNLEKIPFKDSTCTQLGNIEYFFCDGCNKYFLEDGTEISQSDTIVALQNHSPKILPAKSPTCTQEGLTQGSQCEKCGKILTEQQSISKVPHVAGDWVVDKNPTKTENGQKHKQCINCQKVLETQTILWQGDDTAGDLDNKNPDLPDTENPDNNTQKNDAKINTTNILLLVFGGCSVVLIFVVVLKIFKNKRKTKMW